MSGQLDDNELVNLIEAYPILYDKDSARGMKNASRKDAAWQAISSKLGASERACITRWKSIRDRFGKEFRRFQENPNEPTYWDMFPRLLFLKDHYKHGLVKHESLDGMKFEPKERRRRVRSRFGDSEKKLDEEDDLDVDEIELNQQLIELVKMNPVLYDRQKIRDSKNLSAKNEAWRAISENLDVSEELCYNRWKKLRDRFAREYRNHQIQSTPVSWRYFNDLLFLAQHYRKGVPLVIENLKKLGRPPKYLGDNTLNSPTSISIAVGEQVWGTDYPYSTDNDELEDEERYDDPDDDIEVVSDPEQETRYVPLDDFIQVAASPQHQPQQLSSQLSDEPPQSLEAQHLDVTTSSQPMIHETTLHADSFAMSSDNVIADSPANMEHSGSTAVAEKLIGTVIENMETVLRQSKDCLQALHVQNQRHQFELQSSNLAPQSASSVLSKAQMLLDGLSAEQRRSAERKIVHFLCECQIKTLDGEEIEDVTPCQIYNC